MIDVSKYSNKEVRETYEKGCQWLIAHMQETGTDLDRRGEKYNHKVWMAGLKKIEALEDEMRKRKIGF